MHTDRLAYLGPAGTFTEEAVRTQPDLVSNVLVPQRSVPDVIDAVEAGDCRLGVVPLENSVEGSVTVTLDALAFDTSLLIRREIDLPITLNLCAKPGTTLADINTVASHPHGHAQCRRFMRTSLPKATIEAANSTSEAARAVSQSASATDAAICTRVAAELYGLDVLVPGVQDHTGNVTRFVLVGKGIPSPTGHDKTSIVCFQREDRPGSLLAILAEFASRSINLNKLESRPTKASLGDYCFFIDFDGHVADEIVADCLRNLSAKQAEVKFLGSYPVAGDVTAPKRKAMSKRWREANTWISDLRATIGDNP